MANCLFQCRYPLLCSFVPLQCPLFCHLISHRLRPGRCVYSVYFYLHWSEMILFIVREWMWLNNSYLSIRRISAWLSSEAENRTEIQLMVDVTETDSDKFNSLKITVCDTRMTLYLSDWNVRDITCKCANSVKNRRAMCRNNCYEPEVTHTFIC